MNQLQEIAGKLYGNRIRIRVCGICIVHEQILMVCHKGVINDNDVWLPPGGGTEQNETLTEALKREFVEETGLTIEVGALMFTEEFIHEPLHAIELYFAVKVLAGTLKKGIDPELNSASQFIKDVKWIPLRSREFFAEDLYLAINN